MLATLSFLMRFRDAEVRPQGPAPEVGQHTQEILADLGLDAAQMADLVSQGVIGQG